MGVDILPIKPGDGQNFPKEGDTVTIHYTWALKEGEKKLYSSIDQGEPLKYKIGVGQVIKGCDEGVIKLSLGQKAKLVISSDYGYGKIGFGSVIPPDADLIFEVELLAINSLEASR